MSLPYSDTQHTYEEPNMAVKPKRLGSVHGGKGERDNKKKAEIVTQNLAIETKGTALISKNADVRNLSHFHEKERPRNFKVSLCIILLLVIQPPLCASVGSKFDWNIFR
jgi:hypothetical protein